MSSESNYHSKCRMSLFYAGQKTARPQCLRPCMFLIIMDHVHNVVRPFWRKPLGAHGFSLRRIMTLPILVLLLLDYSWFILYKIQSSGSHTLNNIPANERQRGSHDALHNALASQYSPFECAI